MDLKKIEAIVKWRNLESVIRLKLFLGFCNYYRKFITKQLEETELFIKITKKDKPQKQDNEKIELFKKIKKKFIEEPILKIYQLVLPIKIKIDILDFVLKTCLLQKYNKI